MKNKVFFGRKHELSILNRLYNKKIANFVVVRGRRRIGKTALIEQFAVSQKEHVSFISISGLPPHAHTTKQAELNEFAKQLSMQLDMPELYARNWHDLFILLAKQTANKKVIILLDEISWMGSKDADFLGKLKYAWDGYFKKNNNLMLIICGSASQWIEKNILANTGFVGRISYTITLEELSLKEANAFFCRNHTHYSNYEKLKILSITGAVPRYLEEVQTEFNAEDNIKHLCFEKGSFLSQEFKKIFSDLFGNRSKRYKEITQALTLGSLDYTEICQKINLEKSGLISDYLNDLCVSGFLSKDYAWNFKTGTSSPIKLKYRLRDNYLRFYLKYIEKKLPEIERGLFQFKNLNGLAGFSSIMGLQFENLVLNNRQFILKQLNISADDVITENPYFQSKTSRYQGCQIDYLIQTRQNVLYCCEIKFSRNEINKNIIHEVETKLKRLSVPRNFACCPVLIHVNGVSDQVFDSNYFYNIIDFTEAFEY